MKRYGVLLCTILYVTGCSSSSISEADMGATDDSSEPSDNGSDSHRDVEAQDDVAASDASPVPEGQIGKVDIYSAAGGGYAEVRLYDQPYLVREEQLPTLDTCHLVTISERVATAYGQCAARCDSGDYCGIDDSCHAKPRSVRAGNVTVRFGDTTFAAYYPGDVEQQGPEIPGEETVTVSAEGSPDHPAFSATIQSVPKPEVDSPPLKPFPVPIPVDMSSDMSLSWKAFDTSGTIRVVLLDAASTTKESKQIVCHFADDGQATIPNAQMAQLGAGGNWLIDFTRLISSSTATNEGPLVITLRAYSRGMLSTQ